MVAEVDGASLRGRDLAVGVNIRPALWSHSGVARAVTNIVQTLPSLAPNWTFVLYADRKPAPSHPLSELVRRNSQCRLRILPGPSILFETLLLPRAICRDRVDVFLATIPETRIRPGVPTVLTIPDVIPELFPRSVPRRLRLIRATGLVRRNVKRSREILCFSQQTARDIEAVFHVDRARISVSYLGVDPRIARREKRLATAKVRTDFGIAGRFFLMLHVAQYGAFFSSYAAYAHRAFSPMPLVIVGGRQRATQMRDTLAALDLKRHVYWLDEVDDEQLACLYSSCDAFLYPSLYEGFGLPALEAMACGALCIAYGTSSIPEIVGATATLVSPDDHDAMVDALARVSTVGSPLESDAAAIAAHALVFRWDSVALVVAESLMRVAT